MGISSVSAADDICRTKKLSETRSSVRNIVNEVSLPTVHGVQSFDAFVTSNSGLINAFVEDYQRNYGSVRLHVRVDAIFTRDVEDGQQRIPAYFSTRVHDVDPTQQFDLHSVDTDSLRRLTTGTLAAAASSSTEPPSSFSVFLSIGLCTWLSKKKCL